MKLDQIVTFNKRNKMTHNFLVFDVILMQLFRHDDVIWRYGKNNIFKCESRKCSKHEKFNLFLKYKHLKYS